MIVVFVNGSIVLLFLLIIVIRSVCILMQYIWSRT